jgi:hypothetical protein
VLSFQRLDVYRCAIDLLAFCATIDFPRGLSHLSNVLGVLDERRHARAIELVSCIVEMTTKLCR